LDFRESQLTFRSAFNHLQGEEFVSKLSEEALDVSVLPRVSGLNEIVLDASRRAHRSTMNNRSSENAPRARFEPNASVTWGYDAAENRVSDSAQPGSWTYDNLNRMTASPGFTYDHDILGNRLLKSGGGGGSTTTMTWDDLNRMIGFKAGSNAQHVYAYRADGMRTSKSAATGASTATWTRYRYDGQMGVEDIEGTTTNGVSTITAVTRTGLGARSVEVISKTTSSGNTLTYPLYDIHGNMVAALSKAGSTFSVGDARTYDAWGQVRSQVGTDGKLRYCANLGHKQDDESGLIYMRARYYEPSSGRFVSEDQKCDGVNWNIYGRNDPVNTADFDGKTPLVLISLLHVLIEGLIGAFTDLGIQLALNGGDTSKVDWAQVGVAAATGMLIGAFGHFARAAFYSRNAIKLRAWTEEAGGSVFGYMRKFAGIGTATSKGGGSNGALLRTFFLTPGGGALFGQIYGMYLSGLMTGED